MKNLEKIELLAPAGSLEALKVAIASGADAVYISGKSFGARAFATNFTNDEIKKAVLYAHMFERKIYVTINTIVFDDEFEELSRYIDFLYEACVDAIIVQDLGVLHLIKAKYPDFLVHASTQMSIYNEQGIENLKKLGISRAILARETNIGTVRKLSSLGMEIEIFIHGALCYSYSGNCLMSYVHGGRSGNRGACAQPCRKKYSLFENNKLIVDKKSILSMKDLQTINDLDKIIDSGVKSLKIEGRMKSLEYVKNVVATYRKKIDEYYLNNFSKISSDEQRDINVTFNRGFTKGYLLNDSNNNITDFNSVNHQGISIGKVIKVVGNKITISLSDNLSFKDGIRFKGETESGTFINEMFIDGKLVKNASKNDIVTIISNAPCRKGDNVYKTVDFLLQCDAKSIVEDFPLKRKINLNLIIKQNKQMVLRAFDDKFEVIEYSDILNEIARSPFETDRIKTQLSKVNDTLFTISDIEIDYDGKAFFTIKQLNELRRNALSKLEKEIISKADRKKLEICFKDANEISKNIAIEAVVFNEKHKNICEENGIQTIYLGKNYSDRFANEINNEGMIHNLGQIKEDFNNYVPSIYMNIANSSALRLFEKLGIKKTYVSSELDINRIKDLDIQNIEVGYFTYGREDLMVSNQCFIASSLGYDSKKCLSCLKNKYKVLDEYGNYYPVMTDFNNCDIRRNN